MNKHLVWMLLASFLLGFVWGSGGIEAGNGVKPGPETGTAGTGAKTPPTSEKPQAPVPLAMEISPFVHHSAGDVALVIARPSRALNHPIVTGLIKEVDAANTYVDYEKQFKQVEDALQIDPKQIEYVVVSVSSKTLAGVASKRRLGPDNGAPPEVPAFLIRMLTPIDGEAKIAKMEAIAMANIEKLAGSQKGNERGLSKESIEKKEKLRAEFRQMMLKKTGTHRSEYGGVTLYQKGESKDRFCMLNSQTILYAPEAVVKEAIDRKGAAETTPLSAQLQTFFDRDTAIAIDLAPVDAMSQSGQLEIPFSVQHFAAPLLKCRYLSLAADLNGGNLVQVNLVAADEAGAKQLHAMLDPLLTDGIAKARMAKDDPSLPAEAGSFLPLGLKILDGTKLTQTSDLLSLVVARPEGLEELPTLTRSALADTAQKNALKHIGLGMHHFHNTFRHFPANDRGSTESVGLSWRVHILPFVEQAPLYSEFHMDEPWDSDHNKTLIPRMPKIYGFDAEGKSSIHVFVGEGTPFGGNPLRLNDFTDMRSKTIMCVRAGEDTADIWTKPGGLTFDKENPIAALGMIGDLFDVMMFDEYGASAKSFPKTIDAATLGNLIMHNDGNPVEIPK